ncbi:hypothetical protein BaRGS_00008824, partial [Batillaria attramentaria]
MEEPTGVTWMCKTYYRIVTMDRRVSWLAAVVCIVLFTPDSFTVAQEPLAEYDVTTDSWHVMLKCGMFSSMEEPTGVTWMGNSTVDETKARLTLLEANNKQLTDKLGAVVDRIVQYHNSFTVAQEPLAEYDVTTDSWHVMLKCGMFSSMEEPTGVTWMGNSTVDETKARLALLEANNKQLTDKLGAVVDRIVQYHNSFTVAQEPLAEYDVTTDSWHVMLKCGMFSSMEEPTGVTWM